MKNKILEEILNKIDENTKIEEEQGVFREVIEIQTIKDIITELDNKSKQCSQKFDY